MKLDLKKENDRFIYVLERLCKDVGKERCACPTPEVLTAALRGLFPKEFVPPGSVVGIRDNRKASWYHAQEEGEIVPPNRPDVTDLRRILTSYIPVPAEEPQ